VEAGSRHSRSELSCSQQLEVRSRKSLETISQDCHQRGPTRRSAGVAARVLGLESWGSAIGHAGRQLCNSNGHEHRGMARSLGESSFPSERKDP
jgi:hypothetical protein